VRVAASQAGRVFSHILLPAAPVLLPAPHAARQTACVSCSRPVSSPADILSESYS